MQTKRWKKEQILSSTIRLNLWLGEIQKERQLGEKRNVRKKIAKKRHGV